MERDGATRSLWQDTVTDPFKSGNTADLQDSLFDVVIAGAGITGLTAGLLLQKSGKSVLIAEAKTIGFGTSGGTTAHLNTMMDTPYHEMQKKFGENDAQLVARGVQEGLNLIRRNVMEYGIDCGYKELPAFLFSQDDKQSEELDKIFEGTKECHVAAEWANSIPVPFDFKKAVEFPGQSSFHPTRYITALAKEFERAGGILLEDCRVTGIDEGPPHIVKTSRGDIKGQNFIYATHTPAGVNLLHFRNAPWRSYAMAFKLEKETDYPDALAYDMYDPYHYYRTQEIDGELYLIAGGEDHKTGQQENTESCFRKLEAHVRKHFKVVSVTNHWSSQYFESNDGLPYIGELPGHAGNMFVATGYGGNGMVYSAVAAFVLTDMIVNGRSVYAELFDPNRIKLVAGFSSFVKEAADVVGNLLSKILPGERLKELAGLAPGEAKIASYDAHKLAIYKDEQGKIHALNAACTHINCEVGWNSAEKSWDCPCHGSRFSYTGEMLTAPARKDLEQADIKDD